jgi:hypothetical protein
MYLMFPNVSALANEQISDGLSEKRWFFLAFLTVTTIFRRGREVEKDLEKPGCHNGASRFFLFEVILGKGVEALDNPVKFSF